MIKRTAATLTTLAAALLLAACQQQVANNGTAPAASGAAPAPSASGAAASSAPVAAPAGLETEDKQVSYLIGYSAAIQSNLAEMKKFGFDIDPQIVMQAMQDQMDGKEARISPEMAGQIEQSVSARIQSVITKRGEEAKAAGEKFLSENKSKEGVKTTESGLQYKVNKEGTGAQAAKGDMLEVEYEGRLVDGTVFDGTKQHPGGRPFSVPLVDDAVIKGWIEGLQLMKEGGEYTLYIPADLAYGAVPQGSKIPANSALVFDVKVLKVEKEGAKKAMEQAMKGAATAKQPDVKGKK